jgi:class 3 adenylate cyclase
MARSKILEAILAEDNRAVPLKVVFVDVHAYSKRRSRTQSEVVDSFMACLREALERVSRQYAGIPLADGLDFPADVIAIPSGDGAALVFPYAGLFSVHLDFARTLLDVVHSRNRAIGCEKFVAHGWCNCHPAFYLSVGVADGQGIIYRDLNGNYNVAGNVINMAACVRQLAGPGRIFFTEEAHNKIIDMVDNPYLDENFRQFESVGIKHGRRINVYQYIEPDCDSINSTPPRDLALCVHMERVEGRVS